MSCENWRTQLDTYLDGELATAEAAALSAHLRTCAACAVDALGRVRMKRSVAIAGKRYEPSEELRAKIRMQVTGKHRRAASSQWKLLLIPALILLLISVGLNWYVRRDLARRERLYSELADLHVTTLASATQVDVVSSDRHAVKPWFQGKIPFTFNLPELQGTEFTLLGGKVTYLAQTPGAQLIYMLHKHEISVFIFRDQGEATAVPPSNAHRALSFNEENWTQNGLRYFVIGDANADDIEALSKLLQGAG